MLTPKVTSRWHGIVNVSAGFGLPPTALVVKASPQSLIEVAAAGRHIDGAVAAAATRSINVEGERLPGIDAERAPWDDDVDVVVEAFPPR